MIMRECIIVRYGEISLKGGNRSAFERRLVHNIRDHLWEFPALKVVRQSGRIVIEVDDANADDVLSRVANVFGVYSVSRAVIVQQNLDDMTQAAIALLRTRRESLLQEVAQVGGLTFKIAAKRADKMFELSTPQLNEELGARILEQYEGTKVDVHEPLAIVYVEVREDGAYIYLDKQSAVGGMPVGSAGRVGLLLSGGIDSPVAGWLSLKRGVELEAIHFHSYPFTSERALQKVETLAGILANWGGSVRLHTVGFTEVQSEIRKHCPDSLSVTVMRRMMLRIAEGIALSREWQALVTGESLGQVASQTLESIRTINDVTRMPILRPLISEDKVDIIRRARQIGTYETSILPYEDCCTVFLPKRPRTRPTIAEAEQAEETLDVDELVNKAVLNTEMKTFLANRGLNS